MRVVEGCWACCGGGLGGYGWGCYCWIDFLQSKRTLDTLESIGRSKIQSQSKGKTLWIEQVQSSFRLLGKDITIQSKPCPSSSTLGSSSSTLTLPDHATASHPEHQFIKIFGATIYLKDTQSKERSFQCNGDQIFKEKGKGDLSVNDSDEFGSIRKGQSLVVNMAASTTSTMGAGKGFHVAADSQRQRIRKGKSQLGDNMVASTSSTMR